MVFLSAKRKNRSECGGLVLPGGGARGAYQIGVLKAIAEFSDKKQSPFEVIAGCSVGSINATAVAANASDFKAGMRRIESMWRGLRAHDVYRTDVSAVLGNMLHWLAAITIGGMGRDNPTSIFDNGPLRELLRKNINFDAIQKGIDNGDLRALALTASGLTSGYAITFFQGKDGLIGWERARRKGVEARLRAEHLLASAALPVIFKAQHIGSEYFLDGSLRLTAPLSPAIRLGASHILVIGARDLAPNKLPDEGTQAEHPSLGEIGGYMLDIVFSDNLDSDIERMCRINQSLSALPPKQAEKSEMRPIDIHMIHPSRDLRDIAKKHARELPRTIRMLLRGLGAWGKDWRLPSYILFEPGFVGELIDLGYQDAMEQEEILREFLKFSNVES